MYVFGTGRMGAELYSRILFGARINDGDRERRGRRRAADRRADRIDLGLDTELLGGIA